MNIKDMSKLDIQIRLLDVIEEREATAFKLKETNNSEEAMLKYRALDEEMNDLIKALANGQAIKVNCTEEAAAVDIEVTKKAATIITLTYDNTKIHSESEVLTSLYELVKSIKNNETNKEGLKVIVSTDFGKGNRIHHHILVNRKVEIDVREIWENGLSSIQYINEDHYRDAIRYIMH